MVRQLWTATAITVFAASAASAAPFPVAPVDAIAPGGSIQSVQYYYSYPYGGYYVPPPPPPVYYGPRRPPPYRYYAPPPYGYYDKEAAKDYVKAQRQVQKEILKKQIRAWNRANGY